MFTTKKIIELLKKKDISRKELAQIIGMSEKGLGLMLKHNTIKVTTLIEISKALKVDINYWFRNEDDNSLKMEGDFPSDRYSDEALLQIKQATEKLSVKQREIDLLEKRIEDKETITKMLLLENADLRKRLEECESKLDDGQKRRKAG